MKRGIVTRKPYEGERLFFEAKLRDPRIPHSEKEKLRRLLDHPMIRATYNRTEVVMDEKVSQQIQEHVDRRVKNAMKKGLIKPASKNDPFFKFVGKHFKHEKRHDKLSEFAMFPKKTT